MINLHLDDSIINTLSNNELIILNMYTNMVIQL